MSVTQRLDSFQQRHHWAGFPLAVVYKYVDDQGSYLAALIAYYGFLSLVPLLLLASSVLGFVLRGDRELQQRLLDSAVSQIPVLGNQLGDPKGLSGSGAALVVGLVGSLYGGLGVAQAVQNAMNAAWAVPRNKRPNPVLARLRSLLLLATGGLAVLGTTVLSGLGSIGGSLLGSNWRILLTVLSVALNAAVFLLAFRVATARRLSVGDAAPGAVAAAVVWQLLQSFGAVYVDRVVSQANDTYAVFSFTLGLVAFLYLASVAVVLCVEVNVVRTKRLWPRSLLTPFTDDVDLTDADQRAYAGYATAQQNKGFETVDVRFEHDGQNATARRRVKGQGPPAGR